MLLINPYRFAPTVTINSPADISGLQLWLDATIGLYDATSGGSAVTTDGSSVARWEDQSGNGRNATQSTANSRPILKTSIQGGNNILRLDGFNDWLIVDHEILMNTITIFTVFKTAGSNLRLLDQRGTGSTGTVVGWHYKPRNVNNDGFIIDDGNQGYRSVGTNPTSTSFHYSSMIGENNNVNMWVDGSLSNTYTAGSGTLGNFQTTKRIHIGVNVNGQNSQRYNGDVGEIIIYNSALTTQQRQAVESYLANKWGI